MSSLVWVTKYPQRLSKPACCKQGATVTYKYEKDRIRSIDTEAEFSKPTRLLVNGIPSIDFQDSKFVLWFDPVDDRTALPDAE